MLRDFVLVDTSVWIQADRKGQEQLAERVRALLKVDTAAVCGMVYLELMRGAAQYEDKMRTMLERLPKLDMDWPVYEKAAELSLASRRKGTVLSVSDALIAATAIHADVSLFSVDGDFKDIPNLRLF